MGFNGAAGITRRKRTGAACSRTRRSRLQWGRRNYPAETSIRRRRRPGATSLQWGRRNYPAETINVSPAIANEYAGFNGAAGITRRKQLSSSGFGPFQGPLQWGRRNYPAETRGSVLGEGILPRCFNGAAGITRRKPPKVHDSYMAVNRASMGPPELPGGNVQSRRQAEHRRLVASMGPPELPGGNISRPPPTRTARHTASMGPPELPGGNAPAPLWNGLLRRPSFNGAAGITRRKRRYQLLSAQDLGALQWGRRNYPAETSWIPQPYLARACGFNGAAGITRRKPQSDRAVQPAPPGASMGPPELPGGNRRKADRMRRERQLASMGPPELPGGNVR